MHDGSPAIIYANADVVTLDPGAPRVTALAVAGERIVHAGTLIDCRVAAPDAEVVDLAGGHVVPGLVDTHVHFANFAREQAMVDLREADSLDEALERLSAHLDSIPPGTWILGGRWDRNRWRDGALPDRRWLDACAPEHPVALSSHDGHAIWANTRALDAFGIDAATADPDGGRIVRREDGREPTGVLLEAATAPARELWTSDAAGSLPDMLARAFDRALSLGLTAIHDFDGLDAIAAYEAFRSERALPFRVYKTVPVAALDWALERGWRTGDGDVWFRRGPVKMFADGAIGSRSAAMLAPYRDDPSNHGIEWTSPEELLEHGRRAAKGGIATSTHAIGDRANRNVLDMLARLRELGAGAGLRHRIEHAQHLSAADVPRLAELGVTAAMQPIHCTCDMELVETVLPDGGFASYAWRTLMDLGTSVVFGSDAPIESLDPLAGIHAAVTRRRADGTPPGGFQPSECVPAERALRAYTEQAAFASGDEHERGRLSAGMLADFVVLSEDLLSIPAEQILDVQVLHTVVGGRIRWSR
jgi:predicted amidohydrolase YtcJ